MPSHITQGGKINEQVVMSEKVRRQEDFKQIIPSIQNINRQDQAQKQVPFGTHSLAALLGSVGLVNATLERLFTLRSASCDGTGIDALGELTFKAGTAFGRALGIRSAAPGVAIEKMRRGNSEINKWVRNKGIHNSNVNMSCQ